MSRTSLLDLPGEILNMIYELALTDTEEMEVQIDEHGVADESPKHKSALAATCKRVRKETEGLVTRKETSIFIFKPALATTRYGNKTLIALFDLESRLNTIHTYRDIDPKHVVLHVGELEVSNLPDLDSWQVEVERIVKRIPLEGLCRSDIEFAIDIAIVAHPAPAHHYTIRLDDVDSKVPGPDISKAMLAGMKAQKREVSALMPKEWEAMGQTEIAAARIELWNSLHLAQYAVPYVLTKLWHALERVEKGQPRHPTEEEKRHSKYWKRWVVHD